jgi:hypothetical protein
MIYWDLDGVLRDLTWKIPGCKHPKVWSQKGPFGYDVVEYINRNLHLLKECRPTRYLNVAMWQKVVTILTVQRESWKPYTADWLARYIC